MDASLFAGLDVEDIDDVTDDVTSEPSRAALFADEDFGEEEEES